MTAAPPLPISAVILANRDSAALRRCLDTLGDFAEVLIYNNSGAPITPTLAQARVVEGPFDGFGPARNRAASLARHDWIFNIDSDEWLTPELRQSLCSAPLDNPDLVQTFIRRNFMFGQRPRSPLGRELIHRLYHRGRIGWTGKVHEFIGRLDGNPMRCHHLQGELWHDPYESVGQLFYKRWYYAQPQLRDRLKPQHPAVALMRGLWRFIRCYLFQLGLVDGWRGFVVSAAEGYGTFLKYTWAYGEKQRRPTSHESS